MQSILCIVVDFNICINSVKVHEYSHGTTDITINVRDYTSELVQIVPHSLLWMGRRI